MPASESREGDVISVSDKAIQQLLVADSAVIFGD
jgi:hypothetical protein